MSRLAKLPDRLGTLPARIGPSDRQEAERLRDKARRQGGNLRRLYNTKRWRELRLAILERDGWTCRHTGVLLIGEKHAPDSPVIDHIVPHRGDLALFWNPANLQAVSKEYHDSTKQRQEREADRDARQS